MHTHPQELTCCLRGRLDKKMRSVVLMNGDIHSDSCHDSASARRWSYL